jgi:hypothetical protein
VVHRMHQLQGEIIARQDAPPASWEDQDNDIEIKDVDPLSDEFNDVEARFKKQPAGVGPFQATVMKVQRVQHKYLWQRYVSERQELAKRNNGDPNELTDLKHGTGTTAPTTIINSEFGIDHRYSERGLYGKGAYLAELAAYSHEDPYKYKVGDGSYQMFICSVIAGRVEERNCYSDGNCRALVHQTYGYDCVHGPVRDGAPGGGKYEAYILYNPYRCYPEYLVTYTTP